jgi:hypothetical protein
VIVLEAGKRAMFGTQLLYWLDPELLRRARIPAPTGKRQAWVRLSHGRGARWWPQIGAGRIILRQRGLA